MVGLSSAGFNFYFILFYFVILGQAGLLCIALAVL